MHVKPYGGSNFMTKIPILSTLVHQNTLKTRNEDKLTVAFLPNQCNKVLAEADTCFTVIKIPTCHSNYEDFLKYMDISISHGKVGFWKI